MKGRADKVLQIADYYGYDTQSRQCIEEMAELTQAINKHWRKSGSPLEKSVERINEIEEIADVQIMLWQMIYLLGVDVETEFENVIDAKLDRQIRRMKEEANRR